MRLWLHSQAVENYTAGQKCWPFDGGSGYGDTGWGSGDWGVRLALNRDGCAIGSNCRGRHIWPAMQPGLNLPHSRIQMSISVVAVVSISPRRSFIFPALSGPFPFTIPIQLQAPGKPSSYWRSRNAKDGPHPDLVPWPAFHKSGPATRQGVRKNITYKICLAIWL